MNELVGGKRYTKGELVEVARAQGLKATQRLVDDWVGLGLLDQPEWRGLGYGSGSTKGTWPEVQLQLFLSLLRQRSSVTRIPPLCNVPVWLWLYFGDGHAPLRQVRKALQTWAGANKSASWGRAHATAQELLSNFATPEARPEDCDAFVTTFAQMIYQGAFNGDALLPYAERVLNKGETDPISGKLLSAEGFITLMGWRFHGLQAIDTIDDQLFEWARYDRNRFNAQYQRKQPALAADPERGHLYLPIDNAQMVGNACRDLVTTIGWGLEVLSTPSDDTLNHPATWRKLELRSVVQAQQTLAGYRVRIGVETKGGLRLVERV